MSLVQIVQLVCDVVGCYEAYAADFGDLDSGAGQRVRAARQGWRRSNGHDICPRHKPPYNLRTNEEKVA